MRSVRFVCHAFCLFVCEQDYCKSNQPISLKLGVMNFEDMFIRFDRIHKHDRQTHTRTPHNGIGRTYV